MGNLAFGYSATRSTLKVTVLLSRRATLMVSPAFMVFSFSNTADAPFQVTWPAITAGPWEPGVGPGSYQPARSGFLGVSMVPSVF